MKKYLTFLYVALFATLSSALTSCGGSKQETEGDSTQQTENVSAQQSEAEKMFSSEQSVKDGLTHDCFFLSKDGKCLVVFFDDTVEIDEIDEQGEMNELFKSDDCRIATNSKGETYVQIGDRAEFSPQELIIFGGKTYTDFNLYSAGELSKMGIEL